MSDLSVINQWFFAWKNEKGSSTRLLGDSNPHSLTIFFIKDFLHLIKFKLGHK